MNSLPAVMRAALLTGHGGPEVIEVRDDVDVPTAGPGEVLVSVSACGVNNTDINTRIGWYSSEVRSATDDPTTPAVEAGGWGGALGFPRVQGADICGRIVAVGPEVSVSMVGARVLVDPWILDSEVPEDRERARFVGSEIDGGFAEFCVVPARNAHPIDSPLTDVELATFPCAATTAEHLLRDAEVESGSVVVVTGASGGVGTCAVQLAAARGAKVIALAAQSKRDVLLALGADEVVDRRGESPGARIAALGHRVDAVIDVVGGALFGELLPIIRQGGHYVTAGAIAGPIVEFDLRHLIYGDLTMRGSTVCPPDNFARVIDHIEAGRLQPVVAGSFALEEIGEAQAVFLEKRHVGNLVIDLSA